jgi:hypothetical protein
MTNDHDEDCGALSALCSTAVEHSDRSWSTVQARLSESVERLGNEERARLEREIRAILSFQAPHRSANTH